MLMRDVVELFDYWLDFPPTHILVGAFVGTGERRHTEPNAIELQFMSELSGQTGRSYDNLPPDIQQWLQDIKEQRVN